MPNVLIVGATRGLGASLVQKYATENSGTVFATSRSEHVKESDNNVTFVPGIDLSLEPTGAKLVSYLKKFNAKLDIVIITAGYFGTETFDEPKWEEEIKMQVLFSLQCPDMISWKCDSRSIVEKVVFSHCSSALAVIIN